MRLRSLIHCLKPGAAVELCFDVNNIPGIRFKMHKDGVTKIFSEDVLTSIVKGISIDESGILVLNLVFPKSDPQDSADAKRPAKIKSRFIFASWAPEKTEAECFCKDCQYFFAEHHLCLYGTSLVAESTRACGNYATAEK